MPNLYKLGKKMGAEMVRKIKTGDFKGAIEIFNKLKQIDPKIPDELYLYPGMAYAGLEDYDNAINALSKVVLSDVRDTIVLTTFGICYLEKDNPDADAAIKVLDLALKINPNESEIYYRLGQAYRKKKDWESTIFYFEKFLTFNKNVESVWFYIVEALVKTKEIQKAINLSKEALKISKNNYLIWVLLLGLCNKEKKFEEMLYCYENLKKLNKLSFVKAFAPIVEKLKANGIRPRDF